MAFDMFLKIDGIEGESKDAKHKDQIDVLSYSWGVSNAGSPGGGSGGGAGKASFQDFSFVHRTGKASPKLFLACASGKHIKQAVLTCRKAGGKQQEFLKITFSDVLISSFQQGGSTGGDDVPVESVSFDFGKVDERYTEQDASGKPGQTFSGAWDVRKNRSESPER